MMAQSSLPLLVRALRAPADCPAWPLADWDMLLRQAVSANLTAGLWAALDSAGVLDQVPLQARAHLDWARRLAERHARAVHWEVRQIATALAELQLPLILLKGAAYVIGNIGAARGRLFSDIDILVPKERLTEVESALLMHGWMSGHHDPYDQRYYREWMHELPPMQNVRRHTMIDVHHAILPPTARAHPDPALLRASAQPVDAPDSPLPLSTLCPLDMVLHSATHLFYDGETGNALRDMVDLDRMLRQFGSEAAFWEQLPGRARALGLTRPLFYALRYAVWLFDTPVPAACMGQVAQAGGPNPLLLKLMDGLFGRALLPMHSSCDRPGTAAARFILYVRGNWLRMPPLMLARHLFHKAFISPKPGTAA